MYSPALTDGSIGDMIYFHSYKNPGLVLDIVEGMSEFPCCNFLAYCHFWHRLHTVHGWVWNCWSSVHLSVCPIVRSPQAAVGPAGGRYWSIAAWLVVSTQQLLCRCTTCSSKCGQCYSLSWRRKLNRDFLFFFHLTNFLQLLHVFPDFLNCDC